jgi:DHHC palmitoyltransferase
MTTTANDAVEMTVPEPTAQSASTAMNTPAIESPTASPSIQSINGAIASSSIVLPPSIVTWTEISANDDTELVRRWRESPFAVGLTRETWAEENSSCVDVIRHCTPLALTGCCCPYAGRVGNMIVLSQRMESYQDPATGSTRSRPRLLLVLGPYWMVLVFVTIPIFSLLSIYTSYSKVRNESNLIHVFWYITNAGLFFSLVMVGCSNPGILYRHTAPPPGEEAQWNWNDQALTYRPIHAKYDPECAAVIEKFDHTCPWTGTAIGKNNILWFRLFIVFVVMDLLFNAILLVLL